MNPVEECSSAPARPNQYSSDVGSRERACKHGRLTYKELVEASRRRVAVLLSAAGLTSLPPSLTAHMHARTRRSHSMMNRSQ